MSEPTVVDARLDKLEQDNRRLKLTVGALLLVLAGAACAGAMMPQEISERIVAREFTVIDPNGNIRASMSDAGILYGDENENVLAVMSDRGIRIWDENGTNRAGMSTGGIGYVDQNGTIRAGMDDGGIRYTDENGNMRAFMGGDGIVINDENGNEVWCAPC